MRGRGTDLGCELDHEEDALRVVEVAVKAEDVRVAVSIKYSRNSVA